MDSHPVCPWLLWPPWLHFSSPIPLVAPQRKLLLSSGTGIKLDCPPPRKITLLFISSNKSIMLFISSQQKHRHNAEAPANNVMQQHAGIWFVNFCHRKFTAVIMMLVWLRQLQSISVCLKTKDEIFSSHSYQQPEPLKVMEWNLLCWLQKHNSNRHTGEARKISDKKLF